MTLLVVGRGFSSLFCYAFLAAGAVLFVFLPVQDCISLLLYILSFSNVVKLGEEEMSFFTFLFCGLLLRLMLTTKRFDIVSYLSFAIFGVYALAFSGFDQVMRVVSIMTGMILVKIVDDYRIDAPGVIVSFSLGLCVSSVIALFRTHLPQIDRFLSNATLKVAEGEYVSRFAGLQGNPNYYTMDIIIAIACFVVLILSSRPRAIYFVLIGALSLFGMMSLSKSFLLGYGVLLVLWFVCTVRQGGASNALKFVFFGAILVGLVYIFAHDSINLFLYRFSLDEGASLNSISTGRFNIWKVYINEIVHNYRILIFGNGINSFSEIGRSAHNTFFETFYFMGLFGSALLLFATKKAFEGIRWNLILFIPIAVLLVRMLGISLLAFGNLWYYFAMVKLLGLFMQRSGSRAVAGESLEQTVQNEKLIC